MTCEQWGVLLEALTIWRALTQCLEFEETQSWRFWERLAAALSLTVGVDQDPSFQPRTEPHQRTGKTFQFAILVMHTTTNDSREHFGRLDGQSLVVLELDTHSNQYPRLVIHELQIEDLRVGASADVTTSLLTSLPIVVTGVDTCVAKELTLDGWDISGNVLNAELSQIDRSSILPLSTSRLVAVTYKSLRLECGTKQAGKDVTLGAPFADRGNKLQTVRVKQGAHVRAKPEKGAARWITLQREFSLEMCDVDDDSCALSCVLVPGYGFGWVLKSDVLSVSDEDIELPLRSSLADFK